MNNCHIRLYQLRASDNQFYSQLCSRLNTISTSITSPRTRLQQAYGERRRRLLNLEQVVSDRLHIMEEGDENNLDEI